MNSQQIFTSVVWSSSELSKFVKSDGSNIKDVEENDLDESYLDFLRKQIELNARGDEWSDVLRIRLNALKACVGQPLISGRISIGRESIFVKIDPIQKKVLYHEIW